MNLPDNFLSNIRNSFGQQGDEWLVRLPNLLDEAASQWDLLIGKPLLLSYNYVTAAKRGGQEDVVLKIGVPNREFSSELCALQLYNGDGCVRLLDVNTEKFMFLMERLKPGEMLVSLADDEKRTHIACDVMLHLWRPAPDGLALIQLSEWFAGLSKLRPKYAGGSGPFPANLLQQAERLIPELFATSSPPVLIHGDFHHFNVLSSERGWLAIDPKGVIGPPEYDCGPLLINPMPDLATWPDALNLTRRRIAILGERLGFSRDRIRDWGFCHAMLSAWWDFSENETGGEYSLACAEMLARA